jgi:hypothetical protein
MILNINKGRFYDYQLKNKKMINISGLGNLFSSPRFLGILAVAILQALELFGVVTSVHSQGLVQIIQAVIASAVVVGTTDRISSQTPSQQTVVPTVYPYPPAPVPPTV